MFASGFNLIEHHMQKVEFSILFKIATIPLDFIMYDGMGLTFNQENQSLYIP